jgi:2-keto-4-pentenoate hydratase
MSMSPKEVEGIARELLTAYETGQMVSVPASERPGFDLDTAYQVETALKKLREAAGHRAVGRKVGYANKAMWRILKLETLVWAHMYDDTVHYSDRNSATLSVAHPRSLKIEPEIVFGLREPANMEGAPDAAAALMRTEWLAIGFEIIDCPFPEWKFQPSDFVASFGLHAALVIGEKIPVRAEFIPGAGGRTFACQSSGVEEWRFRGRRLWTKRFEESRLVPGGTQHGHCATFPGSPVERRGNRKLGDADSRTRHRRGG